MEAAELIALRDRLRAAGESAGYRYGTGRGPIPATGDIQVALDVAVAACLHRDMPISHYEASHPGVWTFVATELAPELVRWRFGVAGEGDDATWAVSEQRYAGSVRRNFFARLWWRASCFFDEAADDAYWLLRELGEDEQVQFAERPRLAGHGRLTRAAATAVVRLFDPRIHSNRSVLTRNVTMRVLRRLRWLDVHSLEPDELDAEVERVVLESMEGLGWQPPDPTLARRAERGRALLGALGDDRLHSLLAAAGLDPNEVLIAGLGAGERGAWWATLHHLDTAELEPLLALIADGGVGTGAEPVGAILAWLDADRRGPG